eukprot:m.267876 g.267876  ORF g.267876 m.267876 type:complete len:176 (-) comp16251_c0_seq6:647-1174(-)
MGGTQSRVSKTMNGIGLYRYSPDKASWMVLKKDEKRQSEDVLELKVMTYNVWFDSSNRERRFHEILTMLDAENVHVACLQEMCAQTVQLVKEGEIFYNQPRQSSMRELVWNNYSREERSSSINCCDIQFVSLTTGTRADYYCSYAWNENWRESFKWTTSNRKHSLRISGERSHRS